MRGHDLDPISLVFGALFALAGLPFLFARVDAATIHLDRVWPVVVLAMGLLIVALSARRARRSRPAPGGEAEILPPVRDDAPERAGEEA